MSIGTRTYTCMHGFVNSLIIIFRVNSNLDLILSALDLLKYLNMSATPPNDHSAITSPSDLEQLVGYSMEHCAGIERVYSDLQGFNKIVETATKLPHVVKHAYFLTLNQC